MSALSELPGVGAAPGYRIWWTGKFSHTSALADGSLFAFVSFHIPLFSFLLVETQLLIGSGARRIMPQPYIHFQCKHVISKKNYYK